MTALVSVVVPLFRVEGYVERLVWSLACQTMRDFKVILVDDASDDRSLQVAEKALSDRGMSYASVRHEQNQGVSAARNSGMQCVDTPLQICVDPDDILGPEFIETLAASLMSSPAGTVAMSSYQMLSGNDRLPVAAVDNLILSGRQAQRAFLLRRRRMIVPATMFTSEFIARHSLQYSTSIRFGEDVEFLWRAIIASDAVAYNAAPLYGYVRRPGSTMSGSDMGKIITGYAGFVRLAKHVVSNPRADPWVAEWLLSRWVLGALRSSTKWLDWKSFRILAAEMDYSGHCRKLADFPEVRARLLATVLRRSPYVFYQALHL